MILYGAFFIFNLVVAISQDMSMFPFVYLTMTYQIIQITPLMSILWPSCLSNFFDFMWIVNLQTTVFQNMFDVKELYPSVNLRFTEYGFQSRVFLYNCMDAMVLSAVFLFFIPFFSLCYKFVKVYLIVLHTIQSNGLKDSSQISDLHHP